MKKNIYTTYAPSTDMTFIMEEIYDGDKLMSIEVAGFYFGSPNDAFTKEYYRENKADFSAEL